MREQQVSVRAKVFAVLFLSLVAVLVAPSGCATNTQEQPEAGPVIDTGPPNPCGPGTTKMCGTTCVDIYNDTQTCVDTTNDPNNCNSCGNKCPNGYFCQGGVCGLQCSGGTTKCGSACVDESIDINNCGGCSSVCTTGYTCSSAHCCPPTTPVYCG